LADGPLIVAPATCSGTAGTSEAKLRARFDLESERPAKSRRPWSTPSQSATGFPNTGSWARSDPAVWTASSKANGDVEIDGDPRVGGLHHRREWRQAA
jgi:hypothetical protein